MRQAVICELEGVLVDTISPASTFSPSMALPGGKEFFLNCKKAGMKSAVITSLSPDLAENCLQGLGITPDVMCAGGWVRAEKRSLYAALALGLEPSDCLAVESTPAGIAFSHASGFLVCALTTGTDAVSAASTGADIVCTSLAAFSPFDSLASFSFLLRQMCAQGEQVRYGANMITGGRKLYDHASLLNIAVKEAIRCRDHAYAPYSRFKVGAAIVSAATGKVYAGCNVENGSYGATICAERNAILHAIAEEGTIGIDMLVVVSDDDPPAPPCAQCLQVLSEFSHKETEVHLVNVRTGKEELFTFGELLPHPFVLEKA